MTGFLADRDSLGFTGEAQPLPYFDASLQFLDAKFTSIEVELV